MNKEREYFWKIRSENYDKLYWTKDLSFIDLILKMADLHEDQLVLDAGCGTGAIANAIKPHVKHVIGVDISDAMLQKGTWEGISMVKCDLSDHLFADNIFDRITARLVFHHILDDLDRAFIRCYDLLKHGGKLIVAEGVPPVDDDDVVDWYTQMFKHKEERRTFKSGEIAYFMKKNSFVDIHQQEHYMESFSVRNWIENSGLSEDQQKMIIDMHFNADEKIKKAYHMRFINDDCLLRTKSIVTVGRRP